MSLPEIGPMPPEQDSPIGGGLQVVQHKVGPGWYRIFSANVASAQNYAETARIYMEYEHSDGTTSNIFLGVGQVSSNRPFVINDVIVEGPGKITGSVFLLEATTNFQFVANYRKLKQGDAWV